jgi:hypothetical protein
MLLFLRLNEGNGENNDKMLTKVCRIQCRSIYYKANSSSNLLETSLNEKLNEGSFNK